MKDIILSWRCGMENFRDYKYGYGDDMTVTASHCSRFSRKYDRSMFDMTDYRSCENCRYMTPDHRCILSGKGIDFR